MISVGSDNAITEVIDSEPNGRGSHALVMSLQLFRREFISDPSAE
jgi:hypothetical protein